MYNPRFSNPQNFNSFQNPQESPRPAWCPNYPPGVNPNFRPRHNGVRQHYPPKFNNHYRQRFNYNQQPVSQEFWCETCDRGFQSLEILNNHKSEHQICGIDGCKFIAHPKVVTNHIQMQHSTGLYNRIRNIESPEDIAKWIAERKKKFPSRENIEKQKQQQIENIDRGEKIQEKKPRFNNRNKKENTFKRRPNKWNQNKDKNVENKPNRIIKIKPLDDIEDVYCGVPAFKGTSEITRLDIINNISSPTPCESNMDIEDDEWQCKDDESPSVNVAPCSALTILMGAYSSSNEESCDENKTELKADNTKNLEIIAESDGSGPEEVSNIKSNPICDTVIEKTNESCDVDNEKPENSNHKRLRKHKRSSNVNEDSNVADNDTKVEGTEIKKANKRPASTFERQLQYYKNRPSTLLEKLLEKEIKHERNVILQCINYIVKNNFFDTT